MGMQTTCVRSIHKKPSFIRIGAFEKSINSIRKRQILLGRREYVIDVFGHQFVYGIARGHPIHRCCRRRR